MKIVKKIINKSYSQLKSILNKNKFQKALIDKVPLAFHDVAKFSYQKKLRSDDKSLGQLVESFRQKIVSDHQGKKI